MNPKSKKSIFTVIIILILCGGVFAYTKYMPDTNNQKMDTSSSDKIVNPIPEESTGKTTLVNLKDFFPSMSGDLGAYTVSLPSNYVRYDVPPEKINPMALYIWGSPEDLKRATADPSGYIAFNTTKNGLFTVNFTKNVGVNGSGQLIAGGTGELVTEAMIKQQNSEKAKVMIGSLYGLPSAPAFTIIDNLHGLPIRMAYIYSPVDKLVVVISLDGGTDDAVNESIWNNFTTSLNLK
jgi:hypothetical protein